MPIHYNVLGEELEPGHPMALAETGRPRTGVVVIETRDAPYAMVGGTKCLRMLNETFEDFVHRIDQIARGLGVMATIGPA